GKGTHFVPIEGAPRGGLSQRARELVALALCASCLYGLLCLATFRLGDAGSTVIPSGGLTNLGGRVGFHLAYGLDFLFRYAWVVPCLVVVGGGLGVSGRHGVDKVVLRALGGLVLTAMVALLLAGADGQNGVSDLAPWGAGGRLGANLSPRLQAAFGSSGRVLL